MKVLITGSNGFIGNNLKEILDLPEDKKIEIYEYNRSSTVNDLEKYCDEVDVVYHLAAVLRPSAPYSYDDNIVLTTELLRFLRQSKNKCPIMFSSSEQAVLDNPYAISKRREEKLIINYGLENGVNTYIFRLPNLFGRWSKPNYTSVIATFCYNTINNLPITVNDPGRKIKFAEIKTSLFQIIKIVNSSDNHMANRIILIDDCFEVSLGELAYYMGTLKNEEEPKLHRTDNFYEKLYESYKYQKKVLGNLA